MPRYQLAGKTVAITGCTGGLGDALATALRARGANLALMDIDADALAAQAERLGGPGLARPYTADVRDLGSLQAAMDAAASDFGRLDVVIAAAGISSVQSLSHGSPEAFERTIDINLTGVWRTFRAALPHVTANRGYLMAISSMAAFVHSPLQGHYAASKAGVWALCDSVRLELRDQGVGVGSVHPTFFETPMVEQILADEAGRLIWKGHESWPWKMVPLATVVEDTVDAIERRAEVTVVPKSSTIAARAPGFMRPIIERVGWRGDAVARAVGVANSDGVDRTS